MGRNSGFSRMIILLIAGLTIGCSASKNYEKAYRRAWRKIVNSQAWQDALVSNYIEGPLQADVSHPLPSGYNTVELQAFTKGKIDESFLNTYRSLIFRAYFRTIAEAEKADARIYMAYSRLRDQRYLTENRRDPEFREALELAKNRYQAHREMLEGLKSWKAFNEYGSDDLDFFLKDHLTHTYTMYRQGKGEEDILRYLVYRLADLYHFEERQIN
jgi:hypothetical protein